MFFIAKVHAGREVATARALAAEAPAHLIDRDIERIRRIGTLDFISCGQRTDTAAKDRYPCLHPRPQMTPDSQSRPVIPCYAWRVNVKLPNSARGRADELTPPDVVIPHSGPRQNLPFRSEPLAGQGGFAHVSCPVPPARTRALRLFEYGSVGARLPIVAQRFHRLKGDHPSEILR